MPVCLTESKERPMSDKVEEFIRAWVLEHIDAEGYESEDEHPDADRLAKMCLIDAKDVGITKKQIEDAVGDLTKHMSAALKLVNDNEADGLAPKGN
jgi:hypothetical protein